MMGFDIAMTEPMEIFAIWFNTSLFSLKVTAHSGMAKLEQFTQKLIPTSKIRTYTWVDTKDEGPSEE
jgi:hypothetical protein